MQVLYIKYTLWKQIVQDNGFEVYEFSTGTNQYHVWAGSRDVVYRSDVRSSDYSDYNTTFTSRAAVNDEDEALARAINFAGQLEPRTSDGKSVVSLWPAEGSRTTIITHNWADPTTWYANSTAASGIDLTATTPYQVYELPNSNIIDSFHAKIWEEDGLSSDYRVLCEVSSDGGTTWSGVAEEDPHYKEVSGTNGDYIVDYSAGTLSFHSALASGTQVRAFYKHANVSSTGSTFLVAPTAGKSLKLVRAEVQFTTDVDLKDTVIFHTFGYVDVFAPQLVNNVDPDYVTSFPSGTKIPISKTTYKGMRDYYNEANGALPTYPALGGSGWRGVNVPTVVVKWDYAAMLPLSFAAGMEVRIYLEHGQPFGGTYATATLYGLSEDE